MLVFIDSTLLKIDGGGVLAVAVAVAVTITITITVRCQMSLALPRLCVFQ